METYINLIGQVLAGIVTLLLVYTVGQAMYRFVKKPEPYLVEKGLHPCERSEVFYIALLAFVACATMGAFFAIVGFEQTAGTSLEEALCSIFPSSIDADHYLKLAEFGYGTQEAFAEQYLMIVFFPLFPWLVRLVQMVLGCGFYTVGVLLQPFCFAVGMAAFFSLVYHRFGRKTAIWSVVFLFAMPGAFFFAMPMTESLFFALIMLAFCAIEYDNLLFFVLFGFLAALARPTGCLLAGVAGIAFLLSWRCGKVAWKWLAAALAPVTGFLLYLWINWSVYGDCFAFLIYQKEHWKNQFGYIGDTVQYHIRYLYYWWESNRAFSVYVSLYAVVVITVQILLFALCAKKLPITWLGYAVVCWLVSNSVSWLISAPRYALTLVFTPVGLALVCKNKWVRLIVLSLMCLMSVLYLRRYLTWGPIY